MTKQEAWLEIAEMFYKRDILCVCGGIWRLSTRLGIPVEERDQMLECVNLFLRGGRAFFKFSGRENPRSIRSLFCCLMAQLTDEECEELLR